MFISSYGLRKLGGCRFPVPKTAMKNCFVVGLFCSFSLSLLDTRRLGNVKSLTHHVLSCPAGLTLIRRSSTEDKESHSPDASETWKIIEGFPNYEVSSYGNVKNTKTGRVRSSKTKDDRGYTRVALLHNQKRKNVKVHILVAQAFLPNLSEKDCVNHIDKNKENNHVNNLRYVTNSEFQMSKRLASNNKSGVKGVCWDSRSRRWEAYIKLNRKMIHLGLYDTIEEATAIRKTKEIELFGEYR
jgi:hypothetical protein